MVLSLSSRRARDVRVCVCDGGVAVSSKQEWGKPPEDPSVINSPDDLGLISAPVMVLPLRRPYLKLEVGIKVVRPLSFSPTAD